MDTPDDKPLPPIVPQANNVPDDALQQLHEATEKFHRVKEEVDASMGSSEFDHQQGVAAAQERLREAERAIEAADEKVKNSLKR